VLDIIEVTVDITVGEPDPFFTADQVGHPFNGPCGALSCPVAVADIQKHSLQDRFQHPPCRLLDNLVPDGHQPQGADVAVFFGDVDLLVGLRHKAAAKQLFPKRGQFLLGMLFKAVDGFAIDAAPLPFAADPLPGGPQVGKFGGLQVERVEGWSVWCSRQSGRCRVDHRLSSRRLFFPREFNIRQLLGGHAAFAVSTTRS